MAFVIFLLMKGINKLMTIGKKPEVAAAPLTRKCPYCFGEIDVKATKCMHCTSAVTPEK
jgi:large conductance mechanosensitive channel